MKSLTYVVSIFEKLRQSGWGDELDKNDEFTLLSLTEHASVKKPQDLTDRIWSNIKQPLFDILKEIRRERLKVEHHNRLRKRANVVVGLLKAYTLERPVNDIIPGPADICEMDEFKAVIKDTPDDVEVSQDAFEHAMGRLPQLITEWRSAKDAELVRIMKASTALAPSEPQLTSQPGSDRMQLERATTLFECKQCGTTVSYPRILMHHCTHSYSWHNHDVDDPRSILWEILLDVPWNLGGKVGVKVQGKVIASQIVQSCGLDPDTASSQEMDELDARFECVKCFSDKSGRYIMGWRMAV